MFVLTFLKLKFFFCRHVVCSVLQLVSQSNLGALQIIFLELVFSGYKNSRETSHSEKSHLLFKCIQQFQKIRQTNMSYISFTGCLFFSSYRQRLPTLQSTISLAAEYDICHWLQHRITLERNDVAMARHMLKCRHSLVCTDTHALTRATARKHSHTHTQTCSRNRPCHSPNQFSSQASCQAAMLSKYYHNA